MAEFKPPARPPAEALRFFAEKKLRPSFSWKDVWAEEHAHAFTVAKSAGFDVLGDIKGALADALANGETFASFRARLEPILISKGWWGKRVLTDPKTGEKIVAQLGSPRRLKVIFEANVRSARAAGQWERAQRTKDVMPYFEYRLGPSEVHRPHHLSKEGLILPVDDPFWNAWFPPNGWGCKCWLSQLTKKGADAKGGPGTPPEIETREHFNARKGIVEHIPAGIDPGWYTNPGRARARLLADALAERIERQPDDLRRRAIREVVKSFAFADIVEGAAKGVLPVAVMGEADALRLGARTRTILFSDQTAAKQKSREERAEFGAATYLAVQTLADNGRAFTSVNAETGTRSLVFIGAHAAGWWRMAVKVAGDGGLWLSSLHRKTARGAVDQIRKFERK